MENNNNDPKMVKPVKGQSMMQQFLLALIATTISIVLTFGTAAIIDKNQKKAAKKEMVMMLIYDFDQTIKSGEEAGQAFFEASRAQQDLAVHPEHFDSLRNKIIGAMTKSTTKFQETTEKIFSSNIETFNIIGNVSFVSEVSDFYIMRKAYKESVFDKLSDEIESVAIASSLKTVFLVNLYDYAFDNFVYLEDMKDHRNNCMKMMNITEEEVEEFRKQYVNNDEKDDDYWIKVGEMLKESYEVDALIKQAREDYKDK